MSGAFSISPFLLSPHHSVTTVTQDHNCYSIVVVAEPKMSGASSRQSQMVADEMFPDGPGPLDFVDVEDGVRGKWMHALDVGWVQSTS